MLAVGSPFSGEKGHIALWLHCDHMLVGSRHCNGRAPVYTCEFCDTVCELNFATIVSALDARVA